MSKTTAPDYYFQINHPTDPYADPIQGSGDIDDAIAFAKKHSTRITLRDRPGLQGFKLGYVDYDGDYHLG